MNAPEIGVTRAASPVSRGRGDHLEDPRQLGPAEYSAAARDTHAMRPTDYGNAERLVRLFGPDIRYVADEHTWYEWTGKAWVPDADGGMMRRAKAVARVILSEADRVAPGERAGRIRHAATAETRRGLEAMIKLAESETVEIAGRPVPLTVSPSDFDRQPALLNCPNGTVDLHTGELHPHARQDLLRRMTAVPYIAGARSNVWDRFLAQALGGDEDLIDYLQLLAGATLLGRNDHDLIPVLFGPPGSGKTTFAGALQDALGPHYATTSGIETFTTQKRGGGPSEDIARLEGKRMVLCVEAEHDQHLAVGLLKRLAGGDTITARALYRPSRTFRPEMTVWLAVNDLPHVPRDETGLWRRIKVVPFDNPAPNPDRTLRHRLGDGEDNSTAVLAWAIAGAVRLANHDGELTDPGAVTEATRDYRDETSGSPLDAWLTDCALPADRDAITLTGNLRASYEKHCESNKTPPISTKAWGSEMSRRYQPGRTSNARFYRGIVLRGPTAPDAATGDR